MNKYDNDANKYMFHQTPFVRGMPKTGTGGRPANQKFQKKQGNSFFYKYDNDADKYNACLSEMPQTGICHQITLCSATAH